jgi:hypothetical protein
MKTLKMIFASLFDNGVVIKGKDQPWWIALLLFVISVVLATYPTYTQINNRSGSDFLSGNLYSIDNGLQALSETLYEENIQLVIKETVINEEPRRILTNEETAWSTVFTQSIEGYPTFPYFEYAVNNQPRLRVFFQGILSDEDSTLFVNNLLDRPLGDTTISSFMFLGSKAVYVYMYVPTAIASGTVDGQGYVNGFSGTYDAIPLNTNLGRFIALDSSGTFVDPLVSRTTNYQAYADRILANWKVFFDQSFAFSKSVLLFAQTALTFAVNVIMSFLMSVVIFIMTRGKFNPNRHLKFGETTKIGAWTLLSPALLTIVAGGLFPEFAPTAFVLFVGLRLMWLSSKYLRPLEPIQTVTKK